MIGYISSNALKNEIFKLEISKLNLENKIKELDCLILKANKWSDLPPDTSKFRDENVINYIQKKDQLSIQIDHIEKRIEDLKKQIDNMTNLINEMPDGILKKIMKMFFIENSTIKSISLSLGYSESYIYKLLKLKGGD